MLLKNQASSIISTYTADVSGVCSALFEMGGMCVIHDPSGCNSTYNTHDEPRWYDFDSLVFISGLTQMEAIMGDDNKLINDTISAAAELKPKFIALAGSPIPMVMGTDFNAIAKIISDRTGIPCFGFNTNGMHSYISGASLAFSAIAKNFTSDKTEKMKNSVNVLGTTPLDFSVNSYVKNLYKYLNENGYNVVSQFGMGANLSEINNAGVASVNLVVSSSGLMAAKSLYKKFGTPYTVCLPMKDNDITDVLNLAISKNKPIIDNGCLDINSDVTVIGDAVYCAALSKVFCKKFDKKVRVICPPDTPLELIQNGMEILNGENMARTILNNSKTVIADPLYKPLVNDNASFISFPHEAFSGRIFRSGIKDLLKCDII